MNSLKELLSAGKYTEAEATVRGLIDAKPPPEDRDQLLQVLMVCCVGAEDYQGAKAVLTVMFTPERAKDFAVQHAYILYKCGQLEEAGMMIDQAKSSGLGGRPLSLVEAQLAYKLNEFEKALKIYRELLDATSQDDPQYDELFVNYQASLAGYLMTRSWDLKHEQWPSPKPGAATYEALFNSACVAIAKKDYDDAMTTLRAALSLCQESMAADGYSPTDIDREVIAIDMQIELVKGMMGASETSYAYFLKLADSEKLDYATRLTAVNNLLVLSEPKKRRYLSDKYHFFELIDKARTENTSSKTKAMDKDSNVMRLNCWQESIIRCNAASVASYYGQKSRSARQKLHAFQDNPYDEVAVSAKMQWLASSKAVKGRNISPEAFEHIKMLLNKYESPELIAEVLDYLIWAKDYNGAVLVLRLVSNEVNAHPNAFVKILALYYGGSVKDECAEQLKSAYESIAKLSSPIAVKTQVLYGAFLLDIDQDLDLVCQLFGDLAKAHPTDVTILSYLVTAAAKAKHPKTSEYVQMLESVTVAAKSKQFQERPDLEQVWALASELEQNDMKANRKPRGKRVMRRPPKDFEAKRGRKPDPERWVPKKLRAAKKKGRNSSQTGKAVETSAPVYASKKKSGKGGKGKRK